MNPAATNTRHPGDFSVYPLSEKAVTIEFGQAIRPEILRRVTLFRQKLEHAPFPGMIECVPAYCTLTVFYDPVVVTQSKLPGTSCLAKVSAYVTDLREDFEALPEPVANVVCIPVCYGGEYGPDLAFVAETLGLSTAEVVRLHCSVSYPVYMIGFVPGFAYLGGLPDALSIARKETPRQRVPAGSVGLAGLQTGIYPMETPGGWQLIGRTPLQLFNAAHDRPALLKAGDHVRFYAIDEIEKVSCSESSNPAC